MKEEGQWYAADISWQKSRVGDKGSEILQLTGKICWKCSKRKMNNVWGIRSYIPRGRLSFRGRKRALCYLGFVFIVNGLAG